LVFLGELLDGRLLRSAPLLTLKRVLGLTPAEKLLELKESLIRHVAVDAEAIRAWRKR
jgi:hypothetical protein